MQRLHMIPSHDQLITDGICSDCRSKEVSDLCCNPSVRLEKGVKWAIN